MFKRLREAWRPLKEAKPGQRFQAFHHARKTQRRGRPWHWLSIAAGLLLVVIGLILLPAPGPGWLVIFAGLGLLAQESLGMARALDSIEAWVRRRIPGGRKVTRGG